MPRVEDHRAQARKSERKRSEIVRAGLKVFAEKGFHAATMDDIALELDATKGFLYYHFRNKDELLQAVLSNEALLEQVEQIFEDAARLRLGDGLREIAIRLFRLFHEERHVVRFLHVQALLSSKEAQVIYRSVIQRLYAAGARLVRHYQKTREVRGDVDADVVGRSMIDHATVHFIETEVFGSEAMESGRYVESLIDLLLRGIATPAARRQRPRPAATRRR
jgi:AcrR family transcriptional regulator